MKNKVCPDCGKRKLLNEFFRNSARKDGIGIYCKKCEYARCKKHRTTKQGKKSVRKEHLKRTFGLTLEQYDEMFKKQNGKCAICQRPETRKFKGSIFRLGVDHNHNTNKVRELLCYSCNLALGYMDENPELLKKMISYVEKHNC